MFPSAYFAKTYFTGTYFAPADAGSFEVVDGGPRHPILVLNFARMGMK